MENKKIVKLNFQSNNEPQEKFSHPNGETEKSRFQWKETVLIVLAVLGLSLVLIPTVDPLRKIPTAGDIAKERIKSSGDFLVEDMKTTEQNRLAAQEAVLHVYDFDPDVYRKISERVVVAFRFMEEVYRQNSEKAYQAVIDQLEREDRAPGFGAESDREKISKQLQKYYTQIQVLESSTFFKERRDEFRQILGATLTDRQLKTLEWHHFRPSIGETLNVALHQIMDKGVLAKKEFINPTKPQRIRIREIGTDREWEAMSWRDVYDLKQAENVVPTVLRDLVSPEHASLYRVIIVIISQSIQPNLHFNKEVTTEHKKEAAAAVKPVFFQIQKGEIIVREGDRITPEQERKLKTVWLGEQDFNLGIGVIGGILLASLLVFFFWVYLRNYQRELVGQKSKLILIGFVFIGNVALIRLVHFFAGVFSDYTSLIDMTTYFYAIPFITGSILIAMLFTAELTVVFSLFTAITVGILMDQSAAYALLTLAGGLIASYQVHKYRKRSAIILTGIYIGLSNVFLIFALSLLNNRIGSDQAVLEMAFGFSGGILASVLVSGFLPVIESVFRTTSDIRLLELSDLSHPLLNEMVVRAPGTYHHSIMVGNLSEAAAEAVGANALLCRIGGYFHDIGKIGKAEYFVENQKGSESKHDHLSPSMSALILISHVKEGEEIGRKYKLVEPIIDIIREHHGTQLISYFYSRAKEQENPGIQTVNPDDFRYPGPLPSSKEAAIVTLADSIEAACRSLEDPTPSRIEGVVQKILDTKFIDGQLNQSNLTLVELQTITETFVRYLIGIYHQRIAYPDPPEELIQGNHGALREHTDIESAKNPSDPDGEGKKGDGSPPQSVGLS